jgi:hypothetical protein
MMIYLKWTTDKVFNKEMISIFDLEISQKESFFARARLVVDALTALPPTGTKGLIQQEDDEVLFKGFLIGHPVKMEGPTATIELISKPADFLEKVALLQKKSRIPPYWDDLWIRPENHHNLEEVQDVRTASLYCDRITEELSSSDWFEGRQSFPISPPFFPESLTTKIVRSPLKACTIKVHAHWIQSENGISNLGPSIRRAFPHFKVSTYTKNAVLKKWPETGKRLGRSGYWILKSELKTVTPASPLYPSASPSLLLADESDSFKPYRMRRHWFKTTLWVGWEYQQKRKETLSVTLEHDFQPLFPGEGEHKTVEVTLQNINPDPKAYPWRPGAYYAKSTKVTYKNGIYMCKTPHQAGAVFEEDQQYWAFKKIFYTPLGHHARASFFITERGYQAAEHAMERAKVILAQSARSLEVSFEGPWDALKTVTTDTTLTLSDPRLPSGKVRGKVVSYALIAKGETGERFVRVTLLCAAGAKTTTPVNLKETPHYALDDYCEETYQVYENKVRTTPTGLTYFSYDDKGPLDPFQGGPVLRGIKLTNGPEEQEAEMLSYAHTTVSVVKKAVSEKPTQLHLYFKDLRTKEKMEHMIPVVLATPWSAPCQYLIHP